MKPNILLMHCHDLGRHLGCYGIGTVATCAIDQLARDGVLFSRAFSVTSECAPAWASLFFGRYPHSTGVMGRSQPHFAWQAGPEERHLADYLRAAGYRTALIGANDTGAGDIRRTSSFVAPSVQADPTGSARCGFDEAIPLGAGEEVVEPVRGVLDRLGRSGSPWYLQIGFREARRQPSGNPRRPDFTGFLGDHCPPDDSLGVTVPPYILDTPRAREELAELQGAIRWLDRQVGVVLDVLRRAGRETGTLVVFTTDHGLAIPRAKGSLLDGGLETALIVRWPARGWHGGRLVTEPVSSIDVLPTILQSAGIDTGDRLPGVGFRAVLDGEPAPPRGPLFAEMNYHDYYDPARCVRTASHKLILHFSNGRSFHDPSESWKPRLVAAPPPGVAGEAYHPLYELYDLAADPLEWLNVVDEPSNRDTLNDLLARLHGWMKTTSDPLLATAVTSPFHHWSVEAVSDAAKTASAQAGGKAG